MEQSKPVAGQSAVKTTFDIFRTGAKTHQLSRRSIETQDGAQYEIFIAKPVASPPASGYPILYMMDGNGAFDLLTASLLANVPGLCIVGLGYDTPFRFDIARRSLDFTPSPVGIETTVAPGGETHRSGGADLFLARLQDEIIDTVESQMSVDGNCRSIWGHSLGGLIALYALLSGRSRFRRHIAASPAIWWRDGYVLEVESRAVLPYERAEAMIMLGDSERRADAMPSHIGGPAPLTMEMIKRLKARPNLRVSSQIFAGARHVDSLFASLPIALQQAAEL